MKTPILDGEINSLEGKTLSKYAMDMLKEYKAIKKQLETNLTVSTPDNPVWVVDERGEKFALIADIGEKCYSRYILLTLENWEKFLNKEEFDWCWSNNVIPYTEKVNIEVTQDEAVKVKEFLKTLRNGK